MDAEGFSMRVSSFLYSDERPQRSYVQPRLTSAEFHCF
uniref:Uncharacterized protein n=1 Tax=Anguilla anguilla TaxID=7936 RepID=A0A0E9S2X7_ANGAN